MHDTLFSPPSPWCSSPGPSCFRSARGGYPLLQPWWPSPPHCYSAAKSFLPRSCALITRTCVAPLLHVQRAPANSTAPAGRLGGPRTLKSWPGTFSRSEEHTSELQSLRHLVCRLL